MSRGNKSDQFDYDVFLSHSSLDKEVVRELADYFGKRGIKVWLDESAIDVGDLIPSEIADGLARSRHVVLCMSPNFFQASAWSEREIAAVTMQDPNNRKGRVLPLLLEKCELPITLQPLRYADYTNRDKNELGKLGDLILSTRHAPRDEQSDLPLTPPGFFRHFLDRYFPRFHNWLTRVKGDYPPEHHVLAAYNEQVYKDASSKLYEQTIIRLRAKSLETGADQSGRRRGAFHSTIQQVVREIEGREDNQDAASATISALSRKSRPVRNLVSRLLSDDDPLVLLGEPGSGKSLSIHQARLLVAKQNLKRIFPDICIYISLGEFHIESSDVTDAALAEFVKQRVDAQIRPYLWALRRSHRLVVFLDGMDEMSRLRYNDHVEAISDFARAGEGKAKTVVACRTADFSPKFRHRRFVLLPFGRQQIREYLQMQFGSKPVVIDGKVWPLKDLARYLLRSDLPIDATSPYVLWMFCRYIDDEGKWPESRVQLLEHYYKIRLREYFKKEHQDSGDAAIKEVFGIWGRTAFELAIAHRGIAISVNELCDAISKQEVDTGIQKVDTGIKLGRAVGLLEMSLSPEQEADETLVKFEHHRAAEFFTAYHINATSEPVAWEELFDYPRWRETLLNVLLLGKSAAAREAVEMALAKAADLPKKAGDWRYERQLVERVEFAAKAHTDAHQSEDFAKHLADAVYNLAERGNPITRIKMLEIARRTPDVDVHKVAEPSLDSDVQYLRTMALVVASASSSKGSAHFLPNRLLFAFASGEFLGRLGEFLSVVIRLKQLRPMLMVLCGCLFFAILPLLQLAAVQGAASWAERYSAPALEEPASEVNKPSPVWETGFDEWRIGVVGRITGNVSFLKRAGEMTKQRADAERDVTLAKTRSQRPAWSAVSSVLASPWTKASLLCISLLFWVIAALRKVEYLSVSALICGIVSLSLVVVGMLTWMRQEGLAFSVLLATVFVGMGIFLLYALMQALFVGCLVMYSQAVSWIANSPRNLRRYIETSWNPDSNDFLEISIFLLKGFSLFVALSIPGLPSYLVVLDLMGSVLPNWVAEWLLASDFRLSLFSLALLNGLILLFQFLAEYGFRRKRSIKMLLIIYVCVLVGVALAIVILDAVKNFFQTHAALGSIATSSGVWIFRVIVAIVVLVLIGLVLIVMWRLGKLIQQHIGVRVQPARDTRTWLQKFTAADASYQALLLRQVSAERLDLKPEAFLEFLMDTCKPLLKKDDPPESDFWRKLQEANELARLEREGKET